MTAAPDARLPMYARSLPEVRLWLHVVKRAQEQARLGMRDAIEWINGEGLESVCALLDLDPDAVREATWR